MRQIPKNGPNLETAQNQKPPPSCRQRKRLFALFLAIALASTSWLPIFADEVTSHTAEEDALREAIRGSEEEVAASPNGTFNFLTTQMTASEDLNQVEIIVVRNGGTEGEATVTFKATDISAEYGKDYVIKVPRGPIKAALPKNDDAKPLIETVQDGVVTELPQETPEKSDDKNVTNENNPIDQTTPELPKDDASPELTIPDEKSEEPVKTPADDGQVSPKDISTEPPPSETAASDETMEPNEDSEKASEAVDEMKAPTNTDTEDPADADPEKQGDTDDASDSTLSEEPAPPTETDPSSLPAATPSEDELETLEPAKLPVETVSNGPVGLAQAFAASTGQSVAANQWRRSTTEEQAAAKADSDAFFHEVPGVTCDLTFHDGEYMKKLYFCPIDDKLSESEEQVLFSLSNPTAGKLGEFSSAYMNLEDNDEYETPAFELKEKTVEVAPGEKTVQVTLTRTAGLYHYADMMVATAAITAEEGTDYTAIAKELFFTPGMKEQTVEIPILRHEAGEDGDKSFAVLFGSKDSGEFDESLTGLVVIRSEDTDGTVAQPKRLTAAPAANISPYSASTGFGHNLSNYWGWTYDAGDGYHIRIGNENGSACGRIVTDLYGVESISFDWTNYSNGRYWETKKCNKVKDWGYSRCFSVRAGVGSSGDKRVREGQFGWTHENFEISDSEWNQGFIYFATQNWQPDQSELVVNNVSVNYKQYHLAFGNNMDGRDPDAYITPLTYNGTNNTSAGNPIYIGTMKASNDAPSLRYNESVSFVPTYSNPNVTKDKVYLWGFKVEGRGGTYPVTIQGTTLTLNKSTLENLRKNGCILNGNTIKVKPIFKQKISFVQLKFDTIKSGIVGFHNGDVIKLNAFDTLALKGYANAPLYASGYHAIQFNGAGYSESEQYKQTSSNIKRKIFDANRSLGAFDISKQLDPATPGNLNYQPQHSFEQLTMLYDNPELNVSFDPTQKNPDYAQRGVVSVNQSIGDYYTPIRIKPADMGQTYQILGIPGDNFKVIWRDFTNVKGNRSGTGVTSVPVNGNTYYYKPVYPISQIYYTFEPKGTDTTEREIYGSIYLQGGTVINQAKTKQLPLEDAEVRIGGKTTYTDAHGNYSMKSTEFKWEDIYSAEIVYNDYHFITRVEVGAPNKTIISAFDTFTPRDFKIERKKQGQNSFQTVNQNNVDNGSATYRFSFRVDSASPTLQAKQATLRVYGTDKSLKKTYPATLDNNGRFTFSMVPKNESIAPGDYLTLQLADQNGKAYFENDVGVSFIRNVETFNFAQSFNTPVSPVLELVGKVDVIADLGLSGKLDDYFTTTPDAKQKTLTFGFSKEFEKEFKDNDEKKDKVAEGADATNADEQSKTTKDAVDKDTKENQKTSKLTPNASVTLSIALNIVMTKQDNPNLPGYNDYYFESLVLCGIAEPKASIRYEYMTPIGIPVFITGSFSGQFSAAMVIEQYDNKQFFFDGKGTINMLNAGVTDPNRDFTIYGKFYVNPVISLGAGAGFKFLNLEISGTADFQMNFNTLGSGNGNVTLSAKISLKILFIQKTWDLGAPKTYDLFRYGNNARNLPLFGTADYRYDALDTFEQMPREYLGERGTWNGGASWLRAAQSENGNEETIIQAGAYPMSGTKLVPYGDGHILMVFLDDDGSRSEQNRTILKYSIYDGFQWSAPAAVKDDGTLDAEPNLFDLGDDRILLTWSNGDSTLPPDADAIEMLSGLNICGTFFHKSSEGFAPVVDITKTTAEDQTADHLPTAAYDKESGKVILYYTKSEYETPTTENRSDGNKDTEALVGDVLNPKLEKIAYLTYDETNGWKHSYTEEEKAILQQNIPGLDVAQYEKDWYGQQLLDLAPVVTINDDKVETEDGRWNGTPEVDKANHPSARIIEAQAISYNGLALLAYAMDLDGKLDGASAEDATGDQEIFLQIYDFHTNTFTHPIQLTDNHVKDGNLRFVRTNGDTWLYWISDGSIKSMDVSELVRDENALIKPEGYNNVYVLNRYKDSPFPGAATILTPPADRPYDEFEIKTDGDGNIYLAWPQILTTYRDGIDPNSEAAKNPENQYRETQLFLSRFAYENRTEDVPLYNEDGSEMFYPSTTNDGAPIDYNDKSVKDYLIETLGVTDPVHAGDPIVKHTTAPAGTWTKPIQCTFDRGANISNLDFVIEDDGVIRAVYNRADSTVKDALLEVNEATSVLATRKIRPVSKIELTKEDITWNETLLPEETTIVSATVRNQGLDTLKGYTLTLWQQQDGIRTKLDTKSLDGDNALGFVGGSEETCSVTWTVPTSLDRLSIVAELNDPDGQVVDSAEKAVAVQPQLILLEPSIEWTDIDTAQLHAVIRNTGNADAKDAPLTIAVNGDTLVTDQITLPVGAETDWRKTIKLTGKCKPEADDDGNITETASIVLFTNDSQSEMSLTRSATTEEITLMKQLGPLTFHQTSIKLSSGETESLTLSGITPEQAKALDIIWMTDQLDTASISAEGTTCTVLAGKAGTATITVAVAPKSYTYQATNVSGPSYDPQLETRASSILRTVQATVTVNSPTISGGSGDSVLVKPTTPSKPIEPTGPATPSILQSVSYEPKPGENTDYLVLIDEKGTIVKNAWYNPETKAVIGMAPEGSYTVKYNPVSFSDTVGTWANAAVSYLAARDILKGASPNSFDGKQNIRRGDFVLILTRLLDLHGTGTESFADVDPSKYYAQALAAAKENGIVGGVGGNNFAPEREMTREEMFTMTARALEKLGLLDNTTRAELGYADTNEISDYAKDSIARLTAKGLIKGDQNRINPKATATRDETAQFIYNILNRVLQPSMK